MDAAIFWLLILGPVGLGLVSYFSPGSRSRTGTVLFFAFFISGLGLAAAWRGPFSYTPGLWNPFGPWLAFGLELFEDLLITYIGYRLGSRAVVFCGLAQVGLTLTEEFFRLQSPFLSQAPTFVFDPLSIILLLIVCILGSGTAVYALGYMKRHAAHAPASAASNRLFFLILLSFIGVMNGLVLSDGIQMFIIFWEATTLCSFALIAHDRTPQAVSAAQKALLITAFGGVANMLGSVLTLAGYGHASFSGLAAAGASIPIALFCLGGLTKSAIPPFQSWLVGAMVAPTPVSALLHSATMVKAGSYLILRLAPALVQSGVSSALALVGAFSFALTAGMAIGQSNAKKVLAYSTISNLGLIVACAGLNEPLAYAAALMVLCFHAASKGLLFLCVGSIEQEIGSRDIEDMGGIRYRLPMTTVVALIGMASMLIPPFGMLLSKWMAIESALYSPAALLLLIVGSALTMVFWVKWMGRIQTVSFHPEERLENLPWSMRAIMLVFTGIVIVCGAAALPIHHAVFEPLVMDLYTHRLSALASARALSQLMNVHELSPWPFLIFLIAAFSAWLLLRKSEKERHVRLPYLCGENYEGEGLFFSFYGPKDQRDSAWAATVYMTNVFDEKRLTLWGNLLASLLILSMFFMLGAA